MSLRSEDQVDLLRVAFQTLVAALLVAYFLQRLLIWTGRYDLLYPSELIWNTVVYLMPANLLFNGKTRLANSSLPGAEDFSQKHTAKSEVLRSVFGLSSSAPVRRPAQTTRPPGLGNWDHSCYQNSILQALSSIDSFSQYLNDLAQISSEAGSSSTLASLHDLLRALNAAENDGKRLWTPPKLKNMSSWSQQDAQEYFSRVLDDMEKEIKVIVQEPVTSSAAGATLSLDCVDISSDSKEDARGQPRKLNPLEGLLAQRVGCTQCGYVEGLTLIPFSSMTLPLGNGWSYDISECLDDYAALESIDGVECTKCTLSRAKFQLTKLSETLATESEEEEDGASERASLMTSVEARLQAVTEALREGEFDENTLLEKCKISRDNRATSTKSRQAIVLRPPKCLALHINRSQFDEMTGEQRKNYADVRYHSTLDLTSWCLGNKMQVSLDGDNSVTEEWEMDPTRSMLPPRDSFSRTPQAVYELRAVVTHFGRHENGHYICYRKVSGAGTREKLEPDVDSDARLDKNVQQSPEQWWRLSDDDVSSISEEDALNQGGAFMLFYEQTGSHSPVIHQDQSTYNNVAAPAVHSIDIENELVLDGDDQESIVDGDLAQPASVPVRNAAPELSIPILAGPKQEKNAEDVAPEASSRPAVVSVRRQEAGLAMSKPLSPPMMRTAYTMPGESEDLSPFKQLHMVATT